jgi:hypothetical protein
MSEATELFTTADLLAIPFRDPTAGSFIDRVLPNPDGSGLFVVTTDPLSAGGVSYVIEYDFSGGHMTTRFSFAGELSRARRVYGISPDNRWLVVGIQRQPPSPEYQNAWEIYLHSIGEVPNGARTLSYPLVTNEAWPADWLIDWSSDGRWLAVTTGGYVRLIAPDEEYTMPLIVDDAGCTAAVWINEG